MNFISKTILYLILGIIMLVLGFTHLVIGLAIQFLILTQIKASTLLWFLFWIQVPIHLVCAATPKFAKELEKDLKSML